ncbi:MAG: DUF4386 family protein [Anaerolineae bacterium]|nr:DUF4386 family protein [Anaerolineae bacterium]
MMTSNSASNRQMLYRFGALIAVVAALGFRRNIAAELSLFTGRVAPNTAEEWFALLQDNRLLGLAYLNLFDVVNYALLGLLFLVLYVALKRSAEGFMIIAASFGVVGAAVYFASNQALAMLSLSDQYAAATTDAGRAIFLAAGEALLAINNPGAVAQGVGIHLSLLSITLAGLLISLVMQRSGSFNRLTAYLGIVAHVLVLGYFVALIFAPDLTWLPHTLAAIPIVVWELLIAWRLWGLARVETQAAG